MNVASADQATIAGGDGNAVLGLAGAVGGGTANSALSQRAAIGGGIGNRAAYRAFVGGGSNNGALGNVTAVAGGKLNEAQQTGDFVGGGEENIANGPHAIVLGGRSNEAGPNAAIAGGANQLADGAFAFVGGGGDDVDPLLGNRASGAHATVVGGSENAILGSSSHDTIGGGRQNVIDHAVAGQAALIGGGEGNDITSTSSGASGSAILGGLNNSIPDASWAVIGGGSGNVASGFASTVGGGEGNTASGDYATVPGGRNNVAGGDFSFAAGRRAQALDDGAFVFADATDQDFVSTGADQFLVRAAGGVGINTNTPTGALTVAGTVESRGGSGAFVFPDGSQQTTAASGFLTQQTAVPFTTGDVSPPGFQSSDRVVGTIPMGSWSSFSAVSWPLYRSGAVVDDEIHVVGGTGADEHRYYRPDIGFWILSDPIPLHGESYRSDVACVELNGDLYACGGVGAVSAFDQVDRFDPDGGGWSFVGSDPGGGRGDHVAEVVNGKLYLIGGWDGISGVYNTVVEYDPQTDAFTFKTPMPTHQSAMTSGVLGDRIYCVGGNVDPTAVQIYDPATDSWSTGAPHPVGTSDGAGCAFNGHLLTIEPAYEYVPSIDAWYPLSGPPATLQMGNVLGVIDGQLYAVGSSNWTRTAQNVVLDLIVPE